MRAADGGNFGLLVLAEATGTQRFYGYARTQNPQGIGFSTEGFPIENFNDQLQHATGLKRVAASGGLPAYQTNCFVASLGDAVSYQLQLYNGASGTQIGSTLSGSLQPWQQYRYLDVFSAVGAPSGDVTDVRAQFTNLTGTNKKLIGFCTVQDNTSFSADFRIAKSYGGTPQNAFVQGGNAFGTTALLGTVDNQPLSLMVNNQPVTTYLPTATSPNIVSGHPNNSINPAYYGQTIAGGGQGGTNCYDPPTSTSARSCGNQATSDSATIGGGYANRAGSDSTVSGGSSNTANGGGGTVGGGQGNTAISDTSTVGGGVGNIAGGANSTVPGGADNTASGFWSTVGGGEFNTASADSTTVAGGESNTASGNHSVVSGGFSSNATNAYATISGGIGNAAQGAYSTVPGGASNTAAADFSFAAGRDAIAAGQGSFVWADSQAFFFDATNGPGGWCCNRANTFSVRATGGVWFVTAIDPTTGTPTSGVEVQSGSGSWSTYSDRNGKANIVVIDGREVLDRLVHMPISTWNYKAQDPSVRHIGPMAQDFRAAFGLGENDTTISTVDGQGVALAAIQGLNQRELQDRARFQRLLQEKDTQIEVQQREIDAQRAELEAVKEQLTQVESLRAELTALKSALLQQGSSRLAMQATP